MGVSRGCHRAERRPVHLPTDRCALSMAPGPGHYRLRNPTNWLINRAHHIQTGAPKRWVWEGFLVSPGAAWRGWEVLSVGFCRF